MGYPCIYDQLGFGWAIEGFLDDQDSLPASLLVDPWSREAEFHGEVGPWKVKGTLTVEGLVSGKAYVIYRWDSVETAFDYSQGRAVFRFTATGPSEVWEDTEMIPTTSATYYKCVPDGDSSVIV